MVIYNLQEINQLVEDILKIHIEVEIDNKTANETAYKVRIKQGDKKIGFFRDHDLNVAINGALLKSMKQKVPHTINETPEFM